MFAAIDLPTVLPPQASEFARQYDLLFYYITAVCVFGGGVVYALLTYCCFRFAKKEGVAPQRILGSTKLELIWTIVPLIFFLTFFVWGARLFDVAINPPQEAKDNEFFVFGKQWMWKVQHPTGERENNAMHIPVNRAMKVTGTSEDVIHDFGIPAFRSKFDVVPGRYTSAWYYPTKEGTYHLFCDQYCGQGHSQMVGKVHVLSQSDYADFLAGTYRRQNPDGSFPHPVDGSASWRGRKLFFKLNCISCHNKESSARAPSLEGIAGQERAVRDDAGKTINIKASDEYIALSIRVPTKHVRDGWKPIMPAFSTRQVGEQELRDLILYIKSLKPGDLPSRNEYTPAPVGGSVDADSLSQQQNPNPIPMPPQPKKEGGTK